MTLNSSLYIITSLIFLYSYSSALFCSSFLSVLSHTFTCTCPCSFIPILLIHTHSCLFTLDKYRTADISNNSRTMSCPPFSTKSINNKVSESERLLKSQCITLSQAFDHMSTEIHDLRSFFDSATSAMKEYTLYLQEHTVIYPP